MFPPSLSLLDELDEAVLCEGFEDLPGCGVLHGKFEFVWIAAALHELLRVFVREESFERGVVEDGLDLSFLFVGLCGLRAVLLVRGFVDLGRERPELPFEMRVRLGVPLLELLLGQSVKVRPHDLAELVVKQA